MRSAQCAECGLDAATPVEAMRLPRWARWMGVMVGVAMLAWIVVLALVAMDPATQQQSHWGTALRFVEPAMSRKDLRELCAGDAPGRERLVEPMRRMLRVGKWVFPLGHSGIAAQMLEGQGTWSRSEKFGKPAHVRRRQCC